MHQKSPNIKHLLTINTHLNDATLLRQKSWYWGFDFGVLAQETQI